MNKHDKLRVFTAFQHWLGTYYNDLPTDSGSMTERARRYLKENPQALDLFAVSTRTFRFSGMANGVKFVINVQAPNQESAIAYFESEHPKLKWRTTTEITDVS